MHSSNAASRVGGLALIGAPIVIQLFSFSSNTLCIASPKRLIASSILGSGAAAKVVR